MKNFEHLIEEAERLIAKHHNQRRCNAKTRKGTQCQCKALANGRCKFHGGASTGPKTPEGRKRISEAQKRRWKKYRAKRLKSTRSDAIS